MKITATSTIEITYEIDDIDIPIDFDPDDFMATDELFEKYFDNDDIIDAFWSNVDYVVSELPDFIEQ